MDLENSGKRGLFHWNRYFPDINSRYSAEEKELFGTWENEVMAQDKENGDLIHQGDVYDGWSVNDGTIIFTDSSDPDYEWWHKYEIKGKVIFIMPLDEGDN